MSDLPRTTTTGDSRKDIRAKGAGAVDERGDDIHHAEDARLIARGFIAAWKERLARPGTRAEGVPPP